MVSTCARVPRDNPVVVRAIKGHYALSRLDEPERSKVVRISVLQFVWGLGLCPWRARDSASMGSLVNLDISTVSM